MYITMRGSKKCKALVLPNILVLSENIHIGDRRCLPFWQQLEICRLIFST